MSFSWEPFGPSRWAEQPPAPAGRDTAGAARAGVREVADGAATAPARLAAVPDAAPALARDPAQSLVVLTCMDARVDPLAALRLRLGDAHVLRNAGAHVTDDVLRSLRLSQRRAGTRRVILLGHTDCVANGSDEATVAALRRGMTALQRTGALAPGSALQALLYDVATGSVNPVE